MLGNPIGRCCGSRPSQSTGVPGNNNSFRAGDDEQAFANNRRPMTGNNKFMCNNNQTMGMAGTTQQAGGMCDLACQDCNCSRLDRPLGSMCICNLKTKTETLSACQKFCTDPNNRYGRKAMKIICGNNKAMNGAGQKPPMNLNNYNKNSCDNNEDGEQEQENGPNISSYPTICRPSSPPLSPFFNPEAARWWWTVHGPDEKLPSKRRRNYNFSIIEGAVGDKDIKIVRVEPIQQQQQQYNIGNINNNNAMCSGQCQNNVDINQNQSGPCKRAAQTPDGLRMGNPCNYNYPGLGPMPANVDMSMNKNCPGPGSAMNSCNIDQNQSQSCKYPTQMRANRNMDNMNMNMMNTNNVNNGGCLKNSNNNNNNSAAMMRGMKNNNCNVNFGAPVFLGMSPNKNEEWCNSCQNSSPKNYNTGYNYKNNMNTSNNNNSKSYKNNINTSNNSVSKNYNPNTSMFNGIKSMANSSNNAMADSNDRYMMMMINMTEKSNNISNNAPNTNIGNANNSNPNDRIMGTRSPNSCNSNGCNL